MDKYKLKRRFKILLFASLCLVINTGTAVTATIKGSLPSVLTECSGLDFNGNSSFWTHNDSWGDNHLYRISLTGNLQQTITIDGATNRNWEDITHDQNRDYLFIGDFGNNANDRTNLRIYKIPYPNSSTTSIAAEIIEFTYSDQVDFPSAWMNFDVEAFFHFNNRLYLFTKADGSAVGYTKMYSLSQNAGQKVANLVDSFYTNDRTTSASISPDGRSMILMSNSRIHIFTNFSGVDFFNGQHTQLNISGSWTQKEGICFTSNNEVHLTDENTGSGNNLYYLNLSNYIQTSSTTSVYENLVSPVSTFPNPATKLLNFNITKGYIEKEIQLFDIKGRLINIYKLENTEDFKVDISNFTPGIYIYKFFSQGRLIRSDRIIKL
ncbi:MAG: T9SS type A sorting domain-containing protein [Bacteroidota bacterium]